MKKEDLKNTYNKIAEDWHKDHSADDWWVDITNKYLDLLPNGGTILDVGCGAGTKSRFLSEKGFKVTAFDFSEKMIEIAKRENLDIDFLVLDMEKVESLNKEFDGVFAQASLLHIPKKDAPRIVEKLSSVLKRGGYLYIAVKNIREVEEEMVIENDYGYEYERFFSYYNQEEIEKFMEDAGLEVVLSHNDDEYNKTWIQVVGKKV